MNADWFSRDHLSALAGLRRSPTLQGIISTVYALRLPVYGLEIPRSGNTRFGLLSVVFIVHMLMIALKSVKVNTYQFLY
jgi:hypothetical protein